MKQHCKISILLLTLLHFPQAFAVGFPTVDAAGAQLAQQGGWLQVIRLYMGQGATIIGLTLSIAAFIWVGYAALTKFNEARQGRAEWAELSVLAIAGAILLIVNALLLNQVGLATKGLEQAQVARNSERVDNNYYFPERPMDH